MWNILMKNSTQDFVFLSLLFKYQVYSVELRHSNCATFGTCILRLKLNQIIKLTNYQISNSMIMHRMCTFRVSHVEQSCRCASYERLYIPHCTIFKNSFSDKLNFIEIYIKMSVLYWETTFICSIVSTEKTGDVNDTDDKYKTDNRDDSDDSDESDDRDDSDDRDNSDDSYCWEDWAAWKDWYDWNESRGSEEQDDADDQNNLEDHDDTNNLKGWFR